MTGTNEPEIDLKTIWVELDSLTEHGRTLTKFIDTPCGVEADCAMVVGPTGIGKSRLLDSVLSDKRFLPYETSKGTMRPLIRFEAPDTPTSKSISQRFLETQGDPHWEENSHKHQNVLMSRAFNYLRNQQTKLVVIDEAQGFLARTGAYSASEFIKRIVNAGICPIVLAGLPTMLDLLDNEQFSTRCTLIIELSPFNWFDAVHQKEYRQVLKGMQEKVPALSSGVPLSSVAVARGLNYASYGLLRETRQLITAAIDFAAGAPIAMTHLAQAFDSRHHQRRRLGRENRINPFVPGHEMPDHWETASFLQGQKKKRQLRKMDDNFFYPLRDDLRTNESVQSFMLRLTAINDYPTQNFVARDVGLLSCFQRLTPENVERLAQVSRTPADIVTPRAAMVVGKRKVSICGIVLPTQSVIQMVSRLCCACLSKDGYHRVAWNIPAVACCPFCGSRLTDTCPTCNAHLTWNRDDLLKCPEGHPLNARLEVPASERLSRLKISRVIYEKLGEKPDWTSESDLLVSEVRETTLPEFLDLLGLLDLFEDQSQVDPSIEIIDRRLWRCAPVVERWPDAFYDKLRQAHDVRPSGNKALLFDPELGRKIYARQQTNSAKSTEIFKAATNTFIAMNDISVHNASAYADRDDRTYTIFVAATRMNVSPSRLKKNG